MSAPSAQSAGVTADVLFVGITRPAMAFGVPYAALIANGVLTVEAFLLSGNLLSLLISAPVHGLCTLVCRSDARFFEIWAAWVPRAVTHALGTARYWRARSLGPWAAANEPWVRP